jgi:hypothetical protein
MGSPAAEAKPSSAVQYAYMFKKNKGLTDQFDALLRAIAKHIIHEIGDKHEKHLTPTKLAAFYKAVGGDYDSLFKERPDSAISTVWQVTGCQHMLIQPTNEDYAAPSVPALTQRGFSRWESLEILLGPEEHVPFLQFAVKNWNLKHPETGEAFPAELPKDVFPSEPDAVVDQWHQSCAQQLKYEASASDGTPPPPPKAEPVPDHQSHKFAYVHSRGPGAHQKHGEHPHMGRGASHNHGRYSTPRTWDRSPERGRRESPPKTHNRRRSFSDVPSPSSQEPPPHTFPPSYEDHSPKRPSQRRRHSHPRRYSTDETSDEEPAPAKTKRRQHRPESPPPPSVRRFVPPSAPQPPAATSSPPPSYRNNRPEIRVDEPKKRNVSSPRGLRNKISETVSNILPGGLGDRPRSGSRQGSYHDPIPSRRSREHFQPSRLSHMYSDEPSGESIGDSTSEDEAQRRRRSRDERERERERYRDRGRQRDPEERDSGSRRERPHLQRPPIERRTSSHADVDRRRDHPGWDAHNRERIREERRRWDRDRRSPEERGPSPAAGTSGRRYQEPAYG